MWSNLAEYTILRHFLNNLEIGDVNMNTKSKKRKRNGAKYIPQLNVFGN